MLLSAHKRPAFTVLKWPGCVLATGLSLYAILVAVQWIRYGRSSSPRKRAEDEDDLLDRFMPEWDVAEIHKVFLECEPADAYRVACNLDPMQLPLVRFIFRTRSLLLRSSEVTPVQTGGLVSYTESIGWVALAEIPDREILMGSVTKPWQANVTFRPIAPDKFTAFGEPDFVKICWTLRSDRVPGGTLFRTETRAVPTDAGSRRKFRLYWSVFSQGIVLIRRLLLVQIRREAKRVMSNRIQAAAPTQQRRLYNDS
ncbi:MAG: hypothetical protein ACJ746_20440 [Bryobacteraceae bacterium]